MLDSFGSPHSSDENDDDLITFLNDGYYEFSDDASSPPPVYPITLSDVPYAYIDPAELHSNTSPAAIPAYPPLPESAPLPEPIPQPESITSQQAITKPIFNLQTSIDLFSSTNLDAHAQKNKKPETQGTPALTPEPLKSSSKLNAIIQKRTRNKNENGAKGGLKNKIEAAKQQLQDLTNQIDANVLEQILSPIDVYFVNAQYFPPEYQIRERKISKTEFSTPESKRITDRDRYRQQRFTMLFEYDRLSAKISECKKFLESKHQLQENQPKP